MLEWLSGPHRAEADFAWALEQLVEAAQDRPELAKRARRLGDAERAALSGV